MTHYFDWYFLIRRAYGGEYVFDLRVRSKIREVKDTEITALAH